MQTKWHKIVVCVLFAWNTESIFMDVILRTNLLQSFRISFGSWLLHLGLVLGLLQHSSLAVRNLQRSIPCLLGEFCTATHNTGEAWERGYLIPRSFMSVME